MYTCSGEREDASGKRERGMEMEGRETLKAKGSTH